MELYWEFCVASHAQNLRVKEEPNLQRKFSPSDCFSFHFLLLGRGKSQLSNGKLFLTPVLRKVKTSIGGKTLEVTEARTRDTAKTPCYERVHAHTENEMRHRHRHSE